MELQNKESHLNRREFCRMMFFTSLTSVSCRKENKVRSKLLKSGGHEMGMEWWWKLGAESKINTQRHAELTSEIAKRLSIWDGMFSIWREDSELQRWNLGTETNWMNVSPDISKAAKAALEAAKETEGAFNPTMADQLRADGFLPKRIKPHKGGEAPGIEERWHLIEVQENPSRIRKKHPALELDCNSLASGLALDSLADWLAHEGVENFLLFLGGALISKGKASFDQDWKVAIESPNEKGSETMLAQVTLSNMAISTSGIYKQNQGKGPSWKTHLRNGHDGTSVSETLMSVTVKNSSALTSDIWDTALMAVGLEKGMPLAKKKNLSVQWVVKEDSTPHFSMFRIGSWDA